MPPLAASPVTLGRGGGFCRFVVLVRLGVMVVFLRWRCLHPNPDAYPLWLASVICEIWFGVSWILDQIPKWAPIDRETYLQRLALKSAAARTKSRTQLANCNAIIS